MTSPRPPSWRAAWSTRSRRPSSASAPALRQVLAAVLAKGHVLLEDYPGLGKTLAARSFAQALGLDFTRAQFTPDLLPADLTGSFVYDQRRGEFDFRPGPLFTGLLLADEINRTPPKTQSALLEAMQERQITVEGQTFPLPAPFHVLATANPIEYEGTYPLPGGPAGPVPDAGQLRLPHTRRRSTTCSRAGCERRQEEVVLEQVTDGAGLLAMQAAVETVVVDPSVGRYCVDLAAATRSHQDVLTGASPRGSLGLVLAARAFALMRGRDYVVPEDVKAMARPVLSHRITVKPELWMTDMSGVRIVDAVLEPGVHPGDARPDPAMARRLLATDRGDLACARRRWRRPRARRSRSGRRRWSCWPRPFALLVALGVVHRPTPASRVWTPTSITSASRRARAPRRGCDLADADDVEFVTRVGGAAAVPLAAARAAVSAGGLLRAGAAGARDQSAALGTPHPRRREGRRLSHRGRASASARSRSGGQQVRVLPSTAPYDSRAEMPQPIGLVGAHRSSRPGSGTELAGIRAVPGRRPVAPDQLAGLAAHRSPARRHHPRRGGHRGAAGGGRAGRPRGVRWDRRRREQSGPDRPCCGCGRRAPRPYR